FPILLPVPEGGRDSSRSGAGAWWRGCFRGSGRSAESLVVGHTHEETRSRPVRARTGPAATAEPLTRAPVGAAASPASPGPFPEVPDPAGKSPSGGVNSPAV